MNEETFKCSCEQCDGHLEASVQNAGMTVECPHCSKPTRLLMRPGEHGKSGLRLSKPTEGIAAHAESATESLHHDASISSHQSAPGPKTKRSKVWLYYLGFTILVVCTSGYVVSSLKAGHISDDSRRGIYVGDERGSGMHREVYRDKDPVRFYLLAARRGLPAIVPAIIWLLWTIVGGIKLITRGRGFASVEISVGDSATED